MEGKGEWGGEKNGGRQSTPMEVLKHRCLGLNFARK